MTCILQRAKGNVCCLRGIPTYRSLFYSFPDLLQYDLDDWRCMKSSVFFLWSRPPFSPALPGCYLPNSHWGTAHSNAIQSLSNLSSWTTEEIYRSQDGSACVLSVTSGFISLCLCLLGMFPVLHCISIWRKGGRVVCAWSSVQHRGQRQTAPRGSLNTESQSSYCSIPGKHNDDPKTTLSYYWWPVPIRRACKPSATCRDKVHLTNSSLSLHGPLGNLLS